MEPSELLRWFALKVLAERVDRDYVAMWAARLGLEETWQELQRRVLPGHDLPSS